MAEAEIGVINPKVGNAKDCNLQKLGDKSTAQILLQNLQKK